MRWGIAVMSGVYVGFGYTAGERASVNFFGSDLGRPSYDCAALFFEVEDGDLVYFTVDPALGLHELRVSRLSSAATRSLRENTDFIDLPVTMKEHDLLLRTCHGCVKAKLLYNFYDVMLSGVPLFSPEEYNLFDAKRVHNAQFIILVLRECLSPGHRLLPLVRALHSRTTLTGALFDALSTAGIRSRSGSDFIANRA